MAKATWETTVIERAKVIGSAVFPQNDWPWPVQAVKAGVVVLLAAVHALPDIEKALIWAMAFDMASGVVCALKTRGGFVARRATDGALAKTLVFTLVHYLNSLSWLRVDVAGTVMGVGLLIGGWYVLTDWISVAENLHEAGVAMPAWVRPLLAKTRDRLNTAEPQALPVTIQDK